VTWTTPAPLAARCDAVARAEGNTPAHGPLAGPSDPPQHKTNDSLGGTPEVIHSALTRATFESMGLEWEQTIVGARDPAALGRWWLEALGWVLVNDDPDEYEIRPAEDRLPGLLFVSVPEPKTVKNRLHLDFRPDDRDAEVARLLALGASPADVGQGEQSWVVLADPEGNEFCVLRSRPTN
jgi:predicted enzyme related to lactoylglutathione lyase